VVSFYFLIRDYRRMLAQYRENFAQRKVYKWLERLQSGRTSVTGEDYSSCPATSQTVYSVEWVNTLVEEDRQVTVTTIADKLDIGCRSAYSIILKPSDITKVVQSGCQSSLQMGTNRHAWKCIHYFYDNITKERLSCKWIFTGNKTWVHHYEPASKYQSMEWKHIIIQDQEIQKCAFCHQNDGDTVLRL